MRSRLTAYGLPLALFALVHDVAATILRIAAFRGVGAPGLFLAEADGLDLVRSHAQNLHHLLHRVGPALAQGKVVFPASALVGVAFDAHFAPAVLLQVSRVGRHYRLVFVFNEIAVVIEKDAALGKYIFGVAQRAACEWIVLEPLGRSARIYGFDRRALDNRRTGTRLGILDRRALLFLGSAAARGERT